MPASRTVVVAGAGIGGLTAALALTARGFRVVVLEKAERLDDAGAGIQLSPNASHVLSGLGLAPRLAGRAITPDAITIVSARSDRTVARLPLGEAAAFRAGAPYWVMHRADLQAALLAAVLDHPDIDLRLGCQFEDVVSHARGITVGQRKGPKRLHEPALALIGADGIWSAVRGHLFPDRHPQFSGLIAWRGTIDAGELPREYASRGVRLWMGASAHLVAYPVSGGRRVNIVAIVRGAWNRPGWNEPGVAVELKARFSPRWPAAARMVVNAVEDWRRYALFTIEDCPWSDGATALLGDAVHAMLPFAAQGAAMAIEDAAVLAKCLGEGAPDDAAQFPARLQRYAGMRRARIARVQRTAQQAGKIYHLAGASAFARDVAMRALGGKRLLARYDWIYDWRA